MRRLLAALSAGLLILNATTAARAQPPAAAAAAAPWVTPSDAEIRQILVKRIDEEHRGVGIVVGVIDAHGRRIVAYGASDKGDPRPLNGKTIFEIGSMSKVFTSLLLADMAQKGEVKLDDPVAKYLPPGVKMPERGGRQITLIDLSTHTSGLPRMPDNFRPKDPSNPYADYTVQQMYDFLGGYALPRDIGSQFEYSNLGGGLLGHVLARRAGVDYETLVRQRITGPLGMRDTAITLSSALQARLARGHNEALQPVANWDLPTLAGAGALRSDADDILTFLAAELGFTDTPLKAAMAAQVAPRQATGGPDRVAEAWMVRQQGAGTVIWHNGGTGGYRAFMGFDPKARVGVVVLTNVSSGVGGDDIGFHLLTGAPLGKPPGPPPEHHEIVLEPAALERFVGRYQIAPQVFLTVSREGGQLSAQLTGQGPVAIYLEGPNAFFLKVVEAQLVFQADPSGKVTGVQLIQGGRTTSGQRLDEAPAKP